LVCKNDGAVCNDRPHQDQPCMHPRVKHTRQRGCGRCW
jgi:hypothetical protein